jgi:hypothetical protein
MGKKDDEPEMRSLWADARTPGLQWEKVESLTIVMTRDSVFRLCVLW